MCYSLHRCCFFETENFKDLFTVASTVNKKRVFGHFDFVYNEIFSHASGMQ